MADAPLRFPKRMRKALRRLACMRRSQERQRTGQRKRTRKAKSDDRKWDKRKLSWVEHVVHNIGTANFLGTPAKAVSRGRGRVKAVFQLIQF
jgi:hypothetical protein